MRTFIYNKYFIIALGIIALLLRFSLNFYIGNHLNPTIDDDQYYNPAYNLAFKGLYSFDGHTASNFRSPLFPVILAGCFKVVGPNFITPRIILALCDIGIGIMLFFIALLLFKNRAAAVGAMVFWWFNPLQIYYNLFYTVDILLVLLLMLFLYDTLREKYVRAAAFLALATLTKAVALYLIVPLLVFMFFKKQKWTTLAAAFGIFFVLLLPWGIYNQRQFHRFSFGDSGMGKVLWGAHNEVTFGNWRQAGTWYFTPRLQGFTDYEKLTTEQTKDAYAIRMAVQNILRNTPRMPQLMLGKLLANWSFWPGASQAPHIAMLGVGIMSFGWLLPFFILGLWQYRKEKKLYWIWIYILYFQLITIATYGSIRLRMPFTPLVIIIGFAYLLKNTRTNLQSAKK